MLTCKEAAALLRGWDDILVVCHASPDGDALGSMFGLVRGLRALGKRADWYCADPVPKKFAYLAEDMKYLDLLGEVRRADSAGHRPPWHPQALCLRLLGGTGKRRHRRDGLEPA